MKRLSKIIGYTFLLLLLLLLLAYAYVRWGMAPQLPKVEDKTALNLQRQKMADNFYRIGNCWLRKNKSGIWEEYVEGAPFERGVITGKLNKEMLYTQELAFVDQIHQLVPNDNYLSFLGLFTRVFNRELDKYFPEENKLEIYGESFSAPKQFDYILPAYDRMLNYHAAHDIGHALQSLALVGCSSFSAWGTRSYDSTLIVGRNLDFSLGDKFAEDKIVYFCNPTEGHKFAIVTWAGFMGCVSGMNEKGLTVTINAAKSDVPTKATTPISILAREILQYASNINEAYAIAQKRKTFVCETIMIGSASDNQTALIEKSVSKTVLFKSDTNFITCTNHYQSDSFANDANNRDNIATSASLYRYKRLAELMQRCTTLAPLSVADILRNQQGLNDANIGMGNEKAMNQLISHHAVIFQPAKLKMWVTANPYQLGEFVCYDLKKVFERAGNVTPETETAEWAETIPADTFLNTSGWEKFKLFKAMRVELRKHTAERKRITNEQSFVANFINTNPEFWETYFYVAEYFKATHQNSQAIEMYNKALSKEVNDTHEVDKMKAHIAELKKAKG